MVTHHALGAFAGRVPWALLTPLALWTDVQVEAELLDFDLDEQRTKIPEGRCLP
ncbi:hypothetical protein [Streptomyces sp. NPDC001070]